MAQDEEWESTKGSGKVWNPTKEENGDPRTVATPEDFITGYYIDLKHNVGPNSSNLYTLETKEGERLDIWGTKALNDEMEKIRLGQFIKIQWLGKLLTKAGALIPEKQRTSLHSFHQYEVFASKTIPALDMSGRKETTVSTSTSTGTPGAGDAKSNDGQGIAKNNNVVKQEDDLPF